MTCVDASSARRPRASITRPSIEGGTVAYVPTAPESLPMLAASNTSVRRERSRAASNGFGLSSGSVRITSGTNRRLRAFAVTQIAASFVLLAGAGMLLTTLLALQQTRTGFDMHNVLAVDVPVMSYGRTPAQVIGF